MLIHNLLLNLLSFDCLAFTITTNPIFLMEAGPGGVDSN